MTRFAELTLAVAAFALFTGFAALPALGDVLGTGTASSDVNAPPSGAIYNGVSTFDNVTRTVFGTPVNLSDAGTVQFTGQVTSIDVAAGTGTLTLHGVGSPCTLCTASCGSCEAACPLCYNASASFACAPQGCSSGQPASFVGTVTDLTGTAVAGLPLGLSFTTDGTATASPPEPPDAPTTHFVGPIALNAFQSTPTSTGSNVEVTTNTTFVDTKTGAETPLTIDVTYATVNSGGTTTVTALSAPPVALPTGFAADVGQCSKTKSLGCRNDGDCPSGETCNAYHAFVFDVSTTAVVTPPIKICSHYPDTEKKPLGGNGFVDGTGKPGLPEKSLRLFHDEGGVFVDVTLPGYPDTLNNVVCGQVNSLSAFGMYVPTDMPGGSNAATDCVTEWSLCNTVVGGSSSGGGVGTLPKNSATKVVPKPIMTCSLNDPTCIGETPNTCTFCVRVCPNVKDARLFCTPTDIAQYSLTKLTSAADSTNAANILTALQHLPGGTTNANQVSYSPPLSSGLECTDPITLVVPLPSGKKKVTKAIGLTARTSTGSVDANKLSLICSQ